MNPLLKLKGLGQSVWFDSIRRGLITSGELLRMTEEYGVTGVTSNPTIFEKAIAGTAEYDPAIADEASHGKSAEEILASLVTEDIRLSCDVLAPVHRETRGLDGYVSIEVNPLFARDAEATIKDALRLRDAVGRPNVLVKVPATREGLPAIEELTYLGINVNVTLLFSVRRYEEVAGAYIKGLERRAAEGKAVDTLFSVASFFVSRVDTLADRLLGEEADRALSKDKKARLHSLLGKVAVANAKAAHIAFRDIYGGERFRALKVRGARPQRLLWASTGTKNPQYSDVLYVEPLIGRDTVNTMPLQTMLAFHDHGHAALTLGDGLDEARQTLSELSVLGVDCDAMTHQLEEEGIKSFADSHRALIRCITAKKDALAKGAPGGWSMRLGGLGQTVKSAIEGIERKRFSMRLWAKDAALWKEGAHDRKIIANALGWLTLPDVMGEQVDAIRSFAASIKAEGYTSVVLLGMGGSSLAPLVLARTFGGAKGFPELKVLDSTDPGAVRDTLGSIDLEKTLFIVSSKSGSTIEPLSLFEFFRERLSGKTGEAAGRNFIAITDPGTALEGFARKHGFRKVFVNQKDIGGRFSALSFFGLVPAALCGIDIGRLIDEAGEISVSAHPCVPERDNPAVALGAALGALGNAGRDKVTFFLSPDISSFGLWIEQLMAESTGKEGKGLVPVAGEPAGSVDAYLSDRVFVSITTGGADAMLEARLDALSSAGHPVIRFALRDAYALGGEFLRWEIAVAAAGQVIGINPFDQPDVEIAKKLALTRLEGPGAASAPGVELYGARFRVFIGHAALEEMKKEGEAPADAASALKALFSRMKKGDYIGILAYLNPMDGAVEKEMERLRASLRDSTRAATQFGFGPRYLHSTGQLHKGGPNKGVFIIITHSTERDLPVPGAKFGFSGLELSQAYGDMEALDSKGCRVVLVNLHSTGQDTIKELLSFIEGAAR